MGCQDSSLQPQDASSQPDTPWGPTLRITGVVTGTLGVVLPTLSCASPLSPDFHGEFLGSNYQEEDAEVSAVLICAKDAVLTWAITVAMNN